MSGVCVVCPPNDTVWRFSDEPPVWFEARLSNGALAVYRCWAPAGGEYMERIERAWAAGQWLRVVDKGT